MAEAGNRGVELSEMIPGPRRVVLVAVVIVVLSLGALAALGALTSAGQIATALGRADPIWLVPCALAAVLPFAGYALLFKQIAALGQGPRFDFASALGISVARFGAAAIGQAAGSLAIDFAALRRVGVDPLEAGRKVLAANTLQWAVLGASAAALGLLALAVPDLGVPWPMSIGWVVVVTLAVAGAARASARDQRARARRLSERAKRRRPPGPGRWVRRLVALLQASYGTAIGGLVVLRRLMGSPRRGAPAVLGWALYWTGHIVILAAALASVGAAVNPVALVLAFATGFVASAIPLPAGAGGLDAGLALTLSLVGVGLASAILAVLVYRLFTLWLPLVPALLGAPALKRLWEQLPEAVHGAQDEAVTS